MRSNTKRRRIVRMYVSEQIVFATWKPATQAVNIPMILAESFVKSCKRGSVWECLLAEAVKRLANEHPEHFAHRLTKKKYVHVVGNFLYILSKVATRANAPLHQAVRYEHNFTGKLRRFDQYTTQRFLKEFGDQSVTVRIKPPRIHGHPGVRAAVSKRKPGNSRTRIVSGALRRAMDAKLVMPEPLPDEPTPMKRRNER